jgi:hypothetical protein
MIWCDISNYVVQSNGRVVNKAIGVSIPAEHWEIIRECYEPTLVPGGRAELPMAITTSSDAVDTAKYLPLYNEWKNNGGQGPQPDKAPYALPRLDKTNTMDLCTWYLNTMGNGGFTSIDDPTIAKVQEQSFLDGLQNNDKAIDALAQSLTGTILHEVSHT